MKGGTRKRGKTWSYYFDVAAVGGKRKKIEKGGFRTKKEAESALTKALAEYDNSGQLFKPSDISVSDYLDFWYETYCVPNFTENSLRRYKGTINNHLKANFGAYRLKSLQAATVQEVINRMKQQGYSKSTIQSTLSALSSAIDYAIHPMQYIKENPCRLVRVGIVPKPKKEKVIISDEDFQRIIERFPPGSRYRTYLLLGWHCGLRLSECAALTWDDIDFDTRTISITKQFVKRTDTDNALFWAIKEPKYKSFRKITFGETLCQELLAEKKRQTENELKYGSFYTINTLQPFTDEKGRKREMLTSLTKTDAAKAARCNLVCIGENGSFTSIFTFRYCYNIIKNELGVPSFSHHCLRHTHATKLIEAGANIKAVQTRLGHKNIATTMNVYVHHTEDMDKDTADLFEQTITKNATAL